jgi:hypothetical protein
MAGGLGQIGQYVVIPRTTNGVANAGVTLTAPFSIELWVNPNAFRKFPEPAGLTELQD